MSDQLVIAGRAFKSRLIVGTGKYRSHQEMARAHEASGVDMVTVAVRRVNVGVAQPGRLHPDENLTGTRDGDGPVLDDQWLAEAGDDCCAHGILPSTIPSPHPPARMARRAEAIVTDGRTKVRRRDRARPAGRGQALRA